MMVNSGLGFTLADLEGEVDGEYLLVERLAEGDFRRFVLFVLGQDVVAQHILAGHAQLLPRWHKAQVLVDAGPQRIAFCTSSER